jgi:hypothetical protein
MVPDTVVVEERKPAEERKVNKEWYKVTLGLLKIIPMLLAICDALNTLFCLLGYDVIIFSFVGGVSFLTLAFLYLVSYVFRYCVYHRMFLHYVLVNNIISTIEFTVGLPVDFLGLCCIFSINFCVFLFLILYFRKKERRCSK